MADPEVIEIFDDEDADDDTQYDRRALFEPVVRRVVDALGGREDGRYRLGDEVTSCLKDLKKLWRKDDTDDERTIARILWDTRVLPNDLVPILLETAGKGLVEDKRAIYCADLVTAMTWPIDMAEELKELDDELDRGTDYTQLLLSHLHYKAALLRPGVLQAMLGILLPPLAKPPKERKERDGQIVSVVLHLIRNLAFVKDLPSNSHLSSDQAEFSKLQTKLVLMLQDTNILALLVTIAANSTNDPMFTDLNALVLEIFYLLLRGVKPSALTLDQAKQPKENLHRLLAAEAQNRKAVARMASSRHSRFGTTIAVKLNPNKKRQVDGEAAAPPAEPSTRSIVLHRQQALTHDSGSIMDMVKKQKFRKGKTVDALTREDNLSVEAKNILKSLAKDFVEGCFNPFIRTLLKDIRSERAKISDKDNLRLMVISKWFLEFFVALRTKEGSRWNFGLIAEVTEREWIVWVLRRMREALDEKPKLWTELQAGIECMTQILILVDAMASCSETMKPKTPISTSDDPFVVNSDDDGSMEVKEAAELLQQQLIYNGEVLDFALTSLASYKDGAQSLGYLDSSICYSYTLFKMMEKWSKGKEAYVRKKVGKRRKKKAAGDEEGVPEVEEIKSDSEEEVVRETIFTFEAFEMKLANSEITRTLLAYLARYDDFTSSEEMKRIVGLIHRQVVSTLGLFRTILAEQKTLPREQPYKDLVNLINYILRQFFKALEKDSFLAVEAWFPMNRGHWKEFSSYEPEESSKRRRGATNASSDDEPPPEVQVKKGYSWSDELGIAIAALVEDGQKDLINWTKEILTLVIATRQKIVKETDADDASSDDDDEAIKPRLEGPSNDALAKFTDFMVPYTSDEQATAATKNANLKLLFRLAKFYMVDEAADEIQWYIPAAITPDELQRTLKVIDQFLETPFDLNGGRASQLLSKKRRRRRARHTDDVDEEGNTKRKERKKKEKENFKSAEFIVDSDEEYGDIDAFLDKEKEKREAAERNAAQAGKQLGTMRATGTKKRRRKGVEKGKSKKRKGNPEGDDSDDDNGGARSDDDIEVVGSSRSSPEREEPVKPRPRPRPKKSVGPRNTVDGDGRASPVSPVSSPKPSAAGTRRKTKIVISDDEE
ncbi:Topoisomerase 1-associated factor 1 [Pleurotus ostreatus]|uniref:Topoisomerase 1-associated factor 1 n=1 Tax=Pleurotus ostreatus TaxID=5322 RepID=A0A8H7DWD5_PLEOS|nr:Topoisomerase 1-associated factor 1 [Pleurotus ostreatus]KAF7439837.1 Topoisomerase 1-associated factor 1 [Pleurotus ostreatus]